MDSQPYFLEVSDKKSINVAHIQKVYFRENSVEFSILGRENNISVIGKELEAFMWWYENRAIVHRMPEKGK
jgi:hypothetical protein